MAGRNRGGMTRSIGRSMRGTTRKPSRCSLVQCSAWVKNAGSEDGRRWRRSQGGWSCVARWMLFCSTCATSSTHRTKDIVVGASRRNKRSTFVRGSLRAPRPTVPPPPDSPSQGSVSPPIRSNAMRHKFQSGSSGEAATGSSRTSPGDHQLPPALVRDPTTQQPLFLHPHHSPKLTLTPTPLCAHSLVLPHHAKRSINPSPCPPVPVVFTAALVMIGALIAWKRSPLLRESQQRQLASVSPCRSAQVARTACVRQRRKEGDEERDVQMQMRMMEQ